MEELLSWGNPNARILIVFDYPSEEEFRNNKICFGANYNFFKSRIPIGDTYKTVFFNKRHEEIQILVRKNKAKLTGKFLEQFKPIIDENLKRIREEINEIKPRIIIAVGEISLNALANRFKISKYRGSIIPFNERTIVVPILPVRDLFSNPLMEVVTTADLRKALKYLDRPFIPYDAKYRIWICRSAEEFYDFISRVGRPEFITNDIETWQGLLTCMSFCANEEAISIPLLDNRVNPTDFVCLWQGIKYFFNKNIPVVYQNGLYDVPILRAWGFNPNYVDDTMILAHHIYPDFPKTLDFLTSIYTDMEYYKDDVKSIENTFDPSVLKDTLYLYNAKDALATYLIYQEQLKEAKEFCIFDFHKKFFPLVHLYIKINDTGIQIDEEKRQFLKSKYSVLYESTLSSIKDSTGFDVNINSPAQVARLVYEVLKCPPVYHYTSERKRILSTDEDTLEELMLNRVESKETKEILLKLILARKLFRILNFLDYPTINGRIYTAYKLHGTKSGRTSATSSMKYIYQLTEDNKLEVKSVGYSFQTIPKHGYELPDGSVVGNDIMQIYVAEPGYVFVEGDKSQAEARVVCVLAEDFDILPYFDKPPGIHRLTASWITGEDPEKISKESKSYALGKRTRHAANYDMHPYKLSLMAHIPLKQAELVLHKFNTASPKIKSIFHAEIVRRIYDNRLLVTPFGRKRKFFGKLDDELFREAYSYIPQATVSDDLKFSMLRLPSWAKIHVEKHDSLLISVPKERLDEFLNVWYAEMEKPINFRECSLPRDIDLVIPTEVSVGECWGFMNAVPR
jgi:DNA polymerase I-like protein with 3'-5' exonuclease and polymerase domains